MPKSAPRSAQEANTSPTKPKPTPKIHRAGHPAQPSKPRQERSESDPRSNSIQRPLHLFLQSHSPFRSIYIVKTMCLVHSTAPFHKFTLHQTK